MPHWISSDAESMYIYVEGKSSPLFRVTNPKRTYKQEQENKYEEQYCAVTVKNAPEESSSSI